MTEKRGTGVDYGQEKLKERSDNFDPEVNAEGKKQKSKGKLIGILIVSIIGAGALYPVVYGSKNTPKEQFEEVVAVNADGSSPSSANKDAPVNGKNSSATNTPDKAAADKAAADKVAADKAAADKAAADKAAADKAAADKTAAIDPARDASSEIAVDKLVTPDVAPDKAASDGSGRKISTMTPFERDDRENAEQKLLEIASPTNPSTDVTPAAELVNANTPSTLPADDVKGIASAVVSDPTVNATDEAKVEAKTVSQPVTSFKGYDAAKYGIGNDVNSYSVRGAQAQPQETQKQPPRPIAVGNEANSAQLNEPGILKNYKGHSTEVTYEKQSQNTVYLYGDFSAKVYLLPLSKGEKIAAYLSDGKGWEVKQLPGDILRINRSQNKALWTDATDLFLVAGKRTYSFILQAVEKPVQRTDSLVFSAQPSPNKPIKK